MGKLESYHSYPVGKSGTPGRPSHRVKPVTSPSRQVPSHTKSTIAPLSCVKSPTQVPSHTKSTTTPLLRVKSPPRQVSSHTKSTKQTSPLLAPVDICPRRLIDTHTLQLVQLSAEDIVPYAILSHTWKDGEEVSYEEFQHSQVNTKSKSGYRKIQSACGKARNDGLSYIWVDTCCIDQGNHDDVVTNITSMYAYYQNAAVTYAYLADIYETELEWEGEPLFRFSRWFGRGWTLQELLAPINLVFFDRDWKRIGDKNELQVDITWRTTIPGDVLIGEKSIGDVDILDRLSWTMERSTTRPQDKSYCLQGLLGVSIGPDYEEDFRISFHRLGEKLCNAYPELREKLGISDHDGLSSEESEKHLFYNFVEKRFANRTMTMPD